MRIEALAILFTINVAATSMAGADPVLPQEPNLPQFVSPAARADVMRLAQRPNPADETRQAAETLSGRFSEATSPASSADGTGTIDTASIDVQDAPKMQGRVAVLVAESPQQPAHARKPKIGKAKPTAAARKQMSRTMRTSNAGKAKAIGRRPSLHPPVVGPPQDASALASNEVPGASDGWQTGVIGLLTNPAFWH